MPRYKIKAQYMSDCEMIVEVAEGKDPKAPANWGKIEDESPHELYLYDVMDAELLEESKAKGGDDAG